MPVALPAGIFDDSVEAAERLVRVPGVAVLVDGYDVGKLGWPDHSIAEQRRRLVDALSEMSARTGAEVAVVFDGADTVRAPRVRRRDGGYGCASPPGVEADDVVIARAAEGCAFRPVVVASSDNRVRAGSAGAGANVISSPRTPRAMALLCLVYTWFRFRLCSGSCGDEMTLAPAPADPARTRLSLDATTTGLKGHKSAARAMTTSSASTPGGEAGPVPAVP